ncbi:MAG: FAD-dependent oxidoreductase [Nitrososphaerales archaeon]
MRLTGYYLSEGYTTNRGINISFHKNEINYIEDVKNLFRIIFGIIPTTKVTGSTCTIMSFSKILRDLFEKLFKKYAHNKKLPEWMMFLPPRKQAEIIKSVWRGGGCKRDKDFCIVTSSRELAYQIRDILLRLNVIASIRARKLEKLKPTLIDGRNVSFKHGMYYVIVGGPSLKRMSEVLGIYHERIKQRKHTCKHAFIRNGFVLLPIRKIERHSYKGKVYNLIVDKNNTYVAKNFVVHNCDAPFFKDKDVVVVGGGDTAINDALFITKYAKKVTVVHRRNKLRASKILQERAFKNEKINFKWNSVVEDIIGDNKVEGIIIKDVKTGEKSKIECQGVFIAIGHKPNTDLFKGQIEIDDYGYIITKNYTETSVKGVFAAGDVCDYRYKQAVTAAGMGCQAAMDAEKYLESMR